MNGYRFVSAKGKMIAAIIAILLAAVGFCTLGLSAYADAGQVPAHSKTIEENGDGTYKLELSVTGDADNETQESGGANIVVV